MVEIDAVSYAVGGIDIIRDVSVRFPPGRFNVVIGPNGAGKSTLLRIATGLTRATSGAVRYAGRDVAAIADGELARIRAVLSQHLELVFPLPAEDVVLMGRYPHFGRTPGARDRDIVSAALQLVGMTARRHQAYPTLSGGEQQKVQLARVLAQIWSEPGKAEERYLFLDEPTTSLDVHYQLHLLDAARDLARRGYTVVAVLHDLNTAFEYGESFVLLDGGRLVRQSERIDDIAPEAIERAFRVRAERIASPRGAAYWRFTL